MEFAKNSSRLPGTWQFCKYRDGAVILICPQCGGGQYLSRKDFGLDGRSLEKVPCISHRCDFFSDIELLDWRN